MPITVNLDKLFDQAFENVPLADVLNAPVSALQGISERDAELLTSTLGVKTVRDLGSHKAIRVAVAMAELEELAK